MRITQKILESTELEILLTFFWKKNQSRVSMEEKVRNCQEVNFNFS